MLRISQRYMYFLLFSFLSLILLFVGYGNENLNLMFISVILVYFALVSVALHSNDSALYVGFLLTFFVYLLGRYTVFILQGEEWYEGLEFQSASCVCFCFFLSLVSISIGFEITSNRETSNNIVLNDAEQIQNYSDENYSVCIVSKYLFYFTLVFAIIENLETAIFVQANSYLSLYTSFASSLPTIVHKFAGANDLAICIFFATLPSLKETKKISVLYLLCNLITIFSGVRGGIVNSLIFVSLYFFFRQKLCDTNGVDEKWITKSMICVAILILPVAIVLLSLYNTLRDGVSANWNGFFNEIFQFFKDQGTSANVIAYTEYYKSHDMLPSTNQSYFFGPIISLFRYGFLGSIFTGQSEMANNTVEMALYGNNLGATITYLFNPSKYLGGGGLGTEYIAEAFADFGYIGVAVFNLFLGTLLNKANFVRHNKWYINAMLINIILCILRMPRNNAMSFVSALLSIFNWGIIFLVHIVASRKK